MKQALIFLLLFATAFAPAAVAAPRSLQTRSPEAVYYANAYANHYHLPPELVEAIITQESGWNRTAVSSKGALGLMQLMPATAARFGVQDPMSIEDNIGGGVRYLAFLDQMFDGDLRMVVAAYYCGEGPILHSGLEYHNGDVIAYVSSVEKQYEREFEFHHPDSRKGIHP
ncbi:MAG TPA: lytic transglycosylase domain-containing protein [Edaphobacter sp.]|uniref:lytic transglycosylase domain-containing protein n=1 Tax=Edaphobacter sp. TaxID=1934404 RepID=UPI002D0573E2|nr:lytic transglycosylase domain-containing protein [Edaphobacter sp.]HUZ95352.1 lytic transglycosylase domain-containing protein [Edaphobacter sp.]